MINLVWFRYDLRLEDNPALYYAANGTCAVLPVYIHPKNDDGLGSASKWWLHYSLLQLSARFNSLGAYLTILRGSPEDILLELARRCQVHAVYWNSAYDPEGRMEDTLVERTLHSHGIACRVYAYANNLLPIGDVTNKSGTPYKVFTPFYRHAATLQVDKPLPGPSKIACPVKPEASLAIDALKLLPRVDWTQGMRQTWQPGERGAREHLDSFLEEKIVDYATARDYPGSEGTSRLSPHLRFGEISPKTIYHAIVEHCGESFPAQAECFVRQLYWREFASSLIRCFPHMMDSPMNETFNKFPWRRDDAQLRAWQQGRTGFPIVDAGMRELWTTGWMHNRVRMITGSFLVKNLLLSWQEGAAWFWDTLVDADPANNTLGWQWVGGCGPDAAPYFRIFNPLLQARRFDVDGVYVRKWIPELARLENRWLHEPGRAPLQELKDAGVTLGKTYPLPMVDHHATRERALMAYNSIK